MVSGTEQFFTQHVSAFVQTLANLEQRISPDAEAGKDEHYQQVLEAVSRMNLRCREFELTLADQPEVLRAAQERYRSAISPWFDKSWFMHRAKVKPRGYPGDYATLAAIYDRQPKSRGLGGYLDLYFLNTTLGRGVAERLGMARSFLIEEISRRDGEVTVLDVACGPAREYVGGLGLPSHCAARVTCVDYDKECLDFVANHIAVSMPAGVNLRCIHHNALRMTSAKSNLAKFGASDIIYSVGLCDYIPDRHLVPMLQGWRESVSEGGVVYVAFKDCRRYDKTKYQWLVDWFFLQRTEEESRSLFEQAGYDMKAIDMTRDETGAIINFIARTKARTQVRIDVPSPQREVKPVAAPTVRSQLAGEG